MESTTIKLPSTPEELFVCIGSTFIYKTSTPKNPLGKLAKKYSSPGIFHGRPLDQVMIVLAGASGTGKSSTINILFDDELCKVSDTESETSDVTLITKELNIKIDNLILATNLTFVDTPGSLDTDASKEYENFTKIVNFRKGNEALKEREVLKSLAYTYPGVQYMMKQFNIKEKVYPNLVLFVFNAADKRLKGPNTAVLKSLKILKEQDLVDTELPNLILVGTQAAYLPHRKEVYVEKLESVQNLLKQLVHSLFGITNVPVVFVENDAENQRLKKHEDGDYYILPNGELSHANLLAEMKDLFAQNEDKLANLTTAHCVKADCQDKSRKATATIPQYQYLSNPAELEVKERSFVDLFKQISIGAIENEVITPFKLKSLGNGFCPLTETLKFNHLFDDDNFKTIIVKIGNLARFSLPNFVKHFHYTNSNFKIVSFETKEKYEASKIKKYELETEVKLSIKEECSAAKFEKDTISILYEKSICSLQINNPEKYICSSFATVLKSLPAVYDEETAGSFKAFFTKYGTYFVAMQKLGGWIRLDLHFDGRKFNSRDRSKMEEELKDSFKSIIDGEFRWDNDELSEVDILKKQITLGGVDTFVLSQALNEKIQKYLSDIESHPIELEESRTLYPFYWLPQCKNKAALKAATIDHLKGELNFKQKVLTTKDAIAKAAEEEANTESGSCFPGFTIVTTKQGSKRMDELELNDNILTISKDLDSTKWTTIYGFAHKETNKRVEFVQFSFGGVNKLTVTGDHLIFIALLKNGDNTSVPKLAKDVTEGQQLFTCCKDGSIKIQTVLKKSLITCTGIFAPLTTTGNFLADGVWVSCYADIENFELAHAAFVPFRMWAHIKQIFLPKERIGDVEGIHRYARALMKIRDFIM